MERGARERGLAVTKPVCEKQYSRVSLYARACEFQNTKRYQNHLATGRASGLVPVRISTVTQIANIASAKKPSAGSFQEGGIIGGSSFTGDRLQANVNSGEVVFNRRQQENLFNAVNEGNLGAGPSVVINNPVLLEEGAVNQLIDQINDALEFNNKTLGAVS